MPFTTNGGVRLHWEEEGQGTPVLLVMGATYSSEMWWHAAPILAEQHRVIRFDNRGTGQSQATKVATIADMADDGIAVLDAAGVDRAHVWGVSLGGVVVLELARRHPERVASLLVGCSGILTDEMPRAPRWTNVLAYLPLGLRMKLLGRGGNGSACPPELDAKNRAVLAADQTERRGLTGQQNALRAYSISPEEVARAITMPLLVQHGVEDTTVPPSTSDDLHATVPGSKLLTYEGAAHNYILDTDQVATRDAMAFFAEVDARTRA